MTNKSTIYKYQLELKDVQTIKIPYNHKFLQVAEQNGKLWVWVKIGKDCKDKTQDRVIHIYGTGHPIETEKLLIHLGTVVTTPFVWHVFVEWAV